MSAIDSGGSTSHPKKLLVDSTDTKTSFQDPDNPNGYITTEGGAVSLGDCL